jgi:hypothetical protein
MQERQITVTFTETVTRRRSFVLEVPDDVDALTESDVHELLDRQGGWNQLSREDWLTGDVEERTVDKFAICDAPVGTERAIVRQRLQDHDHPVHDGR